MHKRSIGLALGSALLIVAVSRFVGLTPTVEAPTNGTRPDVDTGDEAEADAEIDPKELPIRAAVETFATELDIDPDSVEVISADSVTWPDASLGCPQPDMMYIQVLTEGLRVKLRSGSVEAEYHTDMSTQVTRCDDAFPGAIGQPVDATE